jgi:hypothetical protein
MKSESNELILEDPALGKSPRPTFSTRLAGTSECVPNVASIQEARLARDFLYDKKPVPYPIPPSSEAKLAA